MNPFRAGEQYCLRLPDGRSLGHVRVARIEDDWAEGPFEALADFADVRPLFEEEAALRKDQVIPLWESAADRIEALQIQVIGPDSVVHAPVRLFIDGGEAFLAAPLIPS